MNKPPYYFEQINKYAGSFSPSTVHCQNTALVWYFKRHLFNKVLSEFELGGVPEDWALNYYQTVLFANGYVGIFNTDRYGIIPQLCTAGGVNVFYQPQWLCLVNPKIRGIKRPYIGVNCEVIRILPDWRGIMDIVNTYADLMALCIEGAGVNLVNSKFAFVFGSDTKAENETFKKMYDNITAGNPAAFVDKELFDEDGRPRWILFTQNIGQNYITDKILTDLGKIENMFDTLVGIPNANTSKRERLISDEVNANNDDTASLPTLIVETASRDMARVNNMFGLNLTIKYRHERTITNETNDNGLIQL